MADSWDKYFNTIKTRLANRKEGFEKIFKDMPELENKLSLPKEEIEHIYIYSKVNPEEGLKKLKSLKYTGILLIL